jgi:hypothetical protein
MLNLSGCVKWYENVFMEMIVAVNFMGAGFKSPCPPKPYFMPFAGI